MILLLILAVSTFFFPLVVVFPFFLILSVLIFLVIIPSIVYYWKFSNVKKRPGLDTGGLFSAFADSKRREGAIRLYLWILGSICNTFEDIILGHGKQVKEIDRKLQTGEIPVVFIVGHPRSGSTNMHHCLLNNIEGAHCAILTDLFESKLLVWLMKKLTGLSNRGLKNADVDNHPMKADEPTEVSLRFARYGKGASLLLTSVPEVLNRRGHVEEMLTITKQDISWARQCIARNIVHYGEPTVYIGCILENFDHKLLFEEFGDCRLVCMVRNPVKSHFSFMNLYSSLKQVDLTSEQAMTSYEAFTKPLYKNMLSLAKADDPRIYFQHFLPWVKDTKKEFKKLHTWLGLKGEFKSRQKTEKHANRHELMKLVSEETIAKELGPVFQEILSLQCGS